MKNKGLVSVGVVVIGTLLAWLLIGRTRHGDTVEILGDSITAVSEKVVREGLADYTLNFQAIGGLRTDQLQGAAQDAAASNPKQVIINLGTNEVLQGKGVDQFKANLDRMISTFPSADCIHVVNLNTHMMIAADPSNEAAKDANVAIDELIAAHSNADKIDWDKIVADSIDGAGNETLTVDTIHPNPKGQLLLVQAYVKAVKNCGTPLKV